MPNIEAGPESLRDAAKGSRSMAGELRAIDLRTADRIKRAMPESGAAMNAHRVTDYWVDKFAQLSSALDERADKLAAAADEYDSGERDIGSDFDRMMAPVPESRGKRHPGW